MHRLLADKDLISFAGAVTPGKDAAHHLKVLRPQEGERIELFDGAGTSRVFAYRGGELVPAGETEFAEKAKPSLTLFACVTKGSRWDWTIEKAVELGVTRIVPVISARTIVRIAAGEREAKRERWMRIAEDAARQSDAKWLPEITMPMTFAESLALVRESRCFVGALMTPRAKALVDEVAASTGDGDYSVFIGPEGDFTPEELDALLEIATPTSFGETVLRAETAAIYALSVLAAVKRR